MRDLELASGSVTGARHAAKGHNNQDALAVLRWEGGLAAVVSDGCSSGARSEVGAHLGARLLCQAARRHAALAPGPWEAAAEALAEAVLAGLRPLVLALAGDESARVPEVVQEHFLFTLVGALVLDQETLVFALGDGLVHINGERLRLGPFPDNAPPYLGYRLLTGARPWLALRLLRRLPTAAVQGLALASDGAVDLPRGLIDDLLAEEQTFRSPDSVQRRLSLLNQPGQRGLLPDDTTLILLRPRP